MTPSRLRITAIAITVMLLSRTPAASQSPVQADAGIQLIPFPTSVERDTGWFVIDRETTIDCAAPLADLAEQLRDDLEETTAMRLAVTAIHGEDLDDRRSNAISLQIDDKLDELGPEGYRIDVDTGAIHLRAVAPAGLFYGCQTLRQLLPIQRIVGQPRTQIDWIVPCVKIIDRPRFSWRGLMIDCSRTFQSLEYLHRTIDRIAYYKLNRLHLHLTDDQGWRLQIQAYPELTDRGARFAERFGEPESHQGFYTQAEMAELIRHARRRHVTIVPEIEMPGHSLAALACHPELSCTGGPFEIHPFFKGPGIHEDVFCAGNEETDTFLEKVLDEVMTLFPSPVIHVGGDEVPKTRWISCPRCQARIAAAGLRDEEELQGDFARRIEAFVTARGRRIIGWDEIMQGGLPDTALVMSWRGTRAGLQAARAGHDVVMCPTSHCYFDYTYERTPTSRVYAFEPIPKELDAASRQHILGIQANFWSHIDREPAAVDRQIYPRLLALAERAWSSDEIRSWEDFAWRLELQRVRLDEMGIAYHRRPTAKPTEPDGRWSADRMSEEYRPLEWDVTDKITGVGRYRVHFQYTHGSHRLGIESVEVLVDGRVVGRDVHRGVTGTDDDANDYLIDVDHRPAAARVRLRASARSEGGTDSNGVIYISKESGS